MEKLKIYLARDKDGGLFFYSGEPKKENEIWIAPKGAQFGELPKDMFPEVQWEDKPREAEITINLK